MINLSQSFNYSTYVVAEQPNPQLLKIPLKKFMTLGFLLLIVINKMSLKNIVVNKKNHVFLIKNFFFFAIDINQSDFA